MNTCLLNVLHDSTHIEALPIKEGVDVYLNGIIQEVVHQQWMRRVYKGMLGNAVEVTLKTLLVVDDLHASSAKYERWPD